MAETREKITFLVSKEQKEKLKIGRASCRERV